MAWTIILPQHYYYYYYFTVYIFFVLIAVIHNDFGNTYYVFPCINMASLAHNTTDVTFKKVFKQMKLMKMCVIVLSRGHFRWMFWSGIIKGMFHTSKPKNTIEGLMLITVQRCVYILCVHVCGIFCLGGWLSLFFSSYSLICSYTILQYGKWT